MTIDYAKFIASKRPAAPFAGPSVGPDDVHPMLHDWQSELVIWACKVGRAAIWADTGLGKTVMQLEWARLCAGEGAALIVAPLAVCQQTIREAARLGITARYTRGGSELTPGIWVTNYEMADKFPADQLAAVVLDEASILKQSAGKTRSMLIRHFASVPHRLACTATPAPNDPEELTNQAEFLGHSTRVNMLAAYFVHDDQGWRLKGHARRPMVQWMATWAVAIRRPSDLGYSDDGYDLPGLRIIPHLIEVPIQAEGQLFATDLGGVGGRARVRRLTLSARVDRAVTLVRDCEAQAERSGVHAGVLPSEQGEVGSRRGGPGTSECAPPQEVCREQGLPGPNARKDSRVQGQASASSDCNDVWPDRRRAREDAGSRLPGMRGNHRGVNESDALCGSQPPDRHGPRCSLSAVQSGSGILTGRLVEDHGPVRLPHACRDQWVIWCGLNDEQDALVSALGDDCRSIDGRTPLEDRVTYNESWIRGEFRILVVKPGMYSFGMNWQHCARMIFVGLSDSYEAYYQAIRRCYRYGQTRVVHAHVILSELESQIAVNVARKEREAAGITDMLVAEMRRARKDEAA